MSLFEHFIQRLLLKLLPSLEMFEMFEIWMFIHFLS